MSTEDSAGIWKTAARTPASEEESLATEPQNAALLITELAGEGSSGPPADLYRERRQRLCRQGHEGLLLLVRGDTPFYEDLFYLTGLTTYHTALLLDLRTGEEQVWTWEVEHAQAQAQTDVGAVTSYDPFVSSSTPLLDILHAEICKKKPSKLFVGLQTAGIVPFLLELHTNLATWRSGTDREEAIREAAPLLAPLRRIKDRWELACLARAQCNAAVVVARVVSELHTGMTEREVAGRILAYKIAGGATRPSFPIVAFGENTANTHHLPTSRALRPGDLVLIDAYGEAADQYCAEWTDTLIFEGDDPSLLRRLNAVDAILGELPNHLRPGVTLTQVEQVVEARLHQFGFGDEYPGACAHDVGLCEHDPTDKYLPLMPGQVIALEPSLYSNTLQLGIRRERVFIV